MGLDANLFVGKVDEELICKICLAVFENPVNTSCGHTFCRECITQWLESSRCCPIDKKILDQEKFTEVRALEGLIRKLLMKCKYESSGCKYSSSRYQLSAHEKECTHRPNGYFITSTQRYSPGDVVITSEPLAYILDWMYVGIRCNSCVKLKRNLKICTGCRSFYYCSKKCQKKDWKLHHKHQECQIFNQVKLPKVTLAGGMKIAVRIYATLEGRPETETHIYRLPNGVTITFWDLPVHREEVMKCKELMDTFEIAWQQLTLVKPALNHDKLFDIYCLAITNIYGFSDEKWGNKNIGIALSVETAMMNHSCLPNATLTRALVQEVRVLGDIKPNEELTVSRITYLDKPYLERQDELQMQFRQCNCNRCCFSMKDDKLVASLWTLEKQRNFVLQEHTKISKKLQEITEELINKRLQLFGDYSDRVTYLFTWMMKDYVIFLLNGSEPLVNEQDMLEYIKKNVEVTHGFDDEIYIKYCKMLDAIQILKK